MDTKYSFELKGGMPLLMHNNSVEATDSLMEWRKDPANKNFSVPGDDRSPAWTWQTYIYSDGENITIPASNIMKSIGKAGAQLILKRQKTFKEISQSGILIAAEFCDFFCRDQKISIASIKKIEDWTFAQQSDKVKDFGFQLFVKRAAIGQTQHVRVRPRFDNWSVRGTINVTAPEITQDILTQLFDIAGRGGLGDWRPSAPKAPGPFGMFSATVKKG